MVHDTVCAKSDSWISLAEQAPSLLKVSRSLRLYGSMAWCGHRPLRVSSADLQACMETHWKTLDPVTPRMAEPATGALQKFYG
jgi:hypothetical protein